MRETLKKKRALRGGSPVAEEARLHDVPGEVSSLGPDATAVRNATELEHDLDTRLAEFNKFILHHCASPPAVDVEAVPGLGWGLVANRDIEVGGELLSVPHMLSICPSRFLSQISETGPVGVQLAEVGKELMETPEGSSCLLALGLLYEAALGKHSRLASYLDMLPLPSQKEHPLQWKPKYIESLLRGSHLLERVARTRADLCKEFHGLASELFAHDLATFPAKSYTEELYLWAHAIIQSRVLPVRGELALVPLLDLANHGDSSPHTWSYVKSNDSIALIAGRRVRAGDPVTIDYSIGQRRATWEFFYSYGFVPEVAMPSEDEAAAHWLESGGRPLHLPALHSADLLFQQKKALLVALGFPESVDSGVEVHLRPNAPDEMAPLLRLGHIDADNMPEIAALLGAWEAEPVKVWTQLQHPGSAALERLVSTQLIASCEDALADLPPSIVLAMAAAREPATAEQAREQAVARVMLGERHALEACCGHWQKVQNALDSSQ